MLSKKLNYAVDEFALEMKRRLSEKAEEGYRGWSGKSPTTEKLMLDANKDTCKILKYEKVSQHCVDVANRLMMVWWREGNGG